MFRWVRIILELALILVGAGRRKRKREEAKWREVLDGFLLYVASQHLPPWEVHRGRRWEVVASDGEVMATFTSEEDAEALVSLVDSRVEDIVAFRRALVMLGEAGDRTLPLFPETEAEGGPGS